MTTPRASTTTEPKGPTGAELFGIVIAAFVAAGAGFFAQQHVAALHAELAIAKGHAISGTASAGATGPEEATTASVEPVDEPQAASRGTAPATPQEVRVATLGALAGLISGRSVIPTPMGLAGPLGRGSGPVYTPDKDGHFSQRFGQLFGLSDQDLAALNDSSTNIKQQVDALVAQNTRVTPVPNGYSIEVSAAAGAEMLRDQYLSTLKGVLGDERYHAFAQLNGEVDYTAMIAERQAAAAARGVTLPPAALVPPTRATGPATFFGGFGTDSKTATVTREGNMYRFTYRSGNGGGSGSSATLDQMRTPLGAAVDALPAGF